MRPVLTWTVFSALVVAGVGVSVWGMGQASSEPFRVGSMTELLRWDTAPIQRVSDQGDTRDHPTPIVERLFTELPYDLVWPLASGRDSTVPPYLPGYGPLGDDQPIGGISYTDPTNSGIPLTWVGASADSALTPGFRWSDFAARDGAPFARISPHLVESLERLRREAGDFVVISGYRHPVHNARVGGGAASYHTAGRAADIWSAQHAPLELARLALLSMGCDIGLGLGPRTLHVDVRGELDTWVYEGAAMSSAAFDAWALIQCGRPVPAHLAHAAASHWLERDVYAEGTEAREAGAREAALTAEELLEQYGDAMARYANEQLSTRGPGAVVLDARDAFDEDRLPLRFIVFGSHEAAALKLEDLIQWSATSRTGPYAAYAVLSAQSEPLTGVMNLAAMP